MAYHQRVRCGTCVWSWAISFILSRCARPTLLRLTSRQTISRSSHLLLHKGMDQPQKPCPGKLAESAVATLSPSQMARSAALPGSPCASTSGAEKPMEACAWSMGPASAVVALVRGREQCQWQGSVTKKPRQVSMRLASPCRGVCSSASSVTGADGSIGGHACSCSQANAWRCRWRRPSLPALPARRLPCPGRSGRIIAFRGRSGWRGPARAPGAGQVTIKLFGVPEGFATFLGPASNVTSRHAVSDRGLLCSERLASPLAI